MTELNNSLEKMSLSLPESTSHHFVADLETLIIYRDREESPWSLTPFGRVKAGGQVLDLNRQVRTIQSLKQKEYPTFYFSYQPRSRLMGYRPLGLGLGKLETQDGWTEVRKLEEGTELNLAGNKDGILIPSPSIMRQSLEAYLQRDHSKFIETDFLEWTSHSLVNFIRLLGGHLQPENHLSQYLETVYRMVANDPLSFKLDLQTQVTVSQVDQTSTWLIELKFEDEICCLLDGVPVTSESISLIGETGED